MYIVAAFEVASKSATTPEIEQRIEAALKGLEMPPVHNDHGYECEVEVEFFDQQIEGHQIRMCRAMIEWPMTERTAQGAVAQVLSQIFKGRHTITIERLRRPVTIAA